MKYAPAVFYRIHLNSYTCIGYYYDRKCEILYVCVYMCAHPHVALQSIWFFTNSALCVFSFQFSLFWFYHSEYYYVVHYIRE